MECKNCHSKLEPGQNVSKSLVKCPFCGADLAAVDDMYDNSKDALTCIMRKHGADALLGSRLKSFFNDYAPGVRKSRKNVVFFVIDSKAAEILKRNIGKGAGEQEIAFKQAVQKMIEEYPLERSEVESVVLEFTAALGWKINIQPQQRQAQSPQTTQKQQQAQKPQSPQTTQRQQQAQKPQAPRQKQQATSVQSRNTLTPGQRNVKFGKYNWRVLDVQNGKALLLAEDILKGEKYHSEHVRTAWETCELRKCLNGEFLQTFSS